jgi:exonuclease SbcD
LMDKPIPIDLRKYDLDLALYPAPCTSRLSSENAIGWIRTCGKLPGIAFHIGVAHGSINGISPDFKKEYYPMTQEEIESLGLDLWLMGHTHVRYPDANEGSHKRILFPATPEPDGLDRVHAGYVSIIDIEDNRSFKYRSIETGKHRFFDLDVELSSEMDIDALEADLNKIGSNSAIVRLRLNGHLPSEAIEKLDNLKSELEKSLFFLKFDSSGVKQAVTGKDIDREFTMGSFPHRLLETLISRGADPLVVQTAYDLVQEAKQ